MGVIGGGAWGTALARHCAHMRHDTLLWAREPEVVAGVNDLAVKENVTYLKVLRFRSRVKDPKAKRPGREGERHIPEGAHASGAFTLWPPVIPHEGIGGQKAACLLKI